MTALAAFIISLSFAAALGPKIETTDILPAKARQKIAN